MKQETRRTLRLASGFGSIWISLGVFALFWIGQKTDFAVGFVSSLITGHLIVTFLRLLVPSQRPNKSRGHGLIGLIGTRGFPSGHALRVAILAYWLVLIDSRFLIPAIVMSISVLVARLQLREHRLSDVIIGFLIGGICSAAIAVVL